jgi:hypothetical protein
MIIRNADKAALLTNGNTAVQRRMTAHDLPNPTTTVPPAVGSGSCRRCPMKSNCQLTLLDWGLLPLNFPRPAAGRLLAETFMQPGTCRSGRPSALTGKLRCHEWPLRGQRNGQTGLSVDRKLTIQIPLRWSATRVAESSMSQDRRSCNSARASRARSRSSWHSSSRKLKTAQSSWSRSRRTTCRSPASTC